MCCSFSGAGIRKEIYSLKVYCFSTCDNLWYIGKCSNPILFHLMGTQLHTLHQTRKKHFLKKWTSPHLEENLFQIPRYRTKTCINANSKGCEMVWWGNFPSKKCFLILDLFYPDLTWKVMDTCGSTCFWQMGENCLGSSWLTLRELSTPNRDIFNE